MDISAPHIEYGQIAPILIVLCVAIAGVAVEAAVPRRLRGRVQVPLALVGLAAALAAVVALAGTMNAAVEGAVGIDGPTLFIQGTIIALALISMLLIAERALDPGGGAFIGQASAVPGSPQEREALDAGLTQTEVYPLTMFAVSGMLMFPAANGLLVLFVALEVLSLPLYLLCGLARRRRLLSQEAAMKYFLLGAFSSAFFLYGVAMLYGYAGSVRLADIAAATRTGTGNDVLLLLGIALLGMGLLFKFGAVPFHSWKPDVYQGAPTPVTALMGSCTVVAAFGGLLRVFYVAFPGMRWDWLPLMWGVAIITMIAGAIFAITQADVKRMLAYSSIAHAGFMLTGLVATSQAGLAGSLFYLAAYGFTTIGAFAVVTLVRDAGGEANHLSRWAGLGKRSPLIAGIFAFFLFAFAGIPLTSGFMGKFAVFQAALASGALPLVIVGVVSSAIAVFFYVRVVVLMFFNEPASDGPTVAVPSAFTATAIAVGVAVTVVLGVVPQPVLDLAGQAASQMFIR